MRLHCHRCPTEQGELGGGVPGIETPLSAGPALTLRFSECAPLRWIPETFVIQRERVPQKMSEIWPGRADLQQEKDAHPSNVPHVQTAQQVASQHRNC